MNSNKGNCVKPNGFLIYAVDLKARMLANGHDDMDMQSVIKLATSRWNKLSTCEKEVYKVKAQNSPDIDLKPARRKRKDLDDLLKNLCKPASEPDEADLDLLMMKEITLVVNNAAELKELDSTVFYFISTSCFYDGKEGVFPSELAMSMFSLERGIIGSFLICIDPGELPATARGIVEQRAQKLHLHPPPPNSEGEKDYLTVLETMIRFIHPLKKLPIFFTQGFGEKKTYMTETRKIVEKIFYESAEDDMMTDLEIYPIELLFYLLQREAISKTNKYKALFKSIDHAAQIFNDDKHKFATQACKFHDANAPEHCCLSKVRRYGYTIAQWCSNGKEYELQEGRHFPRNYLSD